jgi:hypothetical protein
MDGEAVSLFHVVSFAQLEPAKVFLEPVKLFLDALSEPIKVVLAPPPSAIGFRDSADG